MSEKKKTIEELASEATTRAYENAMTYYGRVPTLAETSAVLMQAQLSTLAAFLFEDDEHLDYWESVIEVIQGAMGPRGMMS